MLRYFTESEFLNASPSCRLSDMDSEFMKRLDDARNICVVPFVVNSAFRTVDYEKSKGRSGTSSHCKGLAIDIRCKSDQDRIKILLALLAVGFRRIGLYKSFIHVDSDCTKPACVWLG